MKFVVNVKKDWLPFPSWSSKEREEVAALILKGNLDARDLPLWAQNPEEKSYILEKSLQVSGNPALLAKAQIQQSAKTPIQEERLFLKGFAFSRLGREIEAGSAFAGLPARFQAQIQIERGLQRLNNGDLMGAEALFRTAGEDSLDPFSACTLLGGITLALLHQGEFSRAEQCLSQRKKILRTHPSPVLQFGTLLYEILLHLEKNKFQEADLLLQKAITQAKRNSVNGFFLLHLKVRLALARDQLEAAEAGLGELKSLMIELELPEGVLDFRLEEIELFLRKNDTKLAQSALRKMQEFAAKKTDDYLRFRLALLEAASLAQARDGNAALASIEKAIELGESRQYRPGLTWAFFHAAGIALAANQPMRARLFLNRGKNLCEKLRLEVRLAGFSYMAEVLENRYASASALLSLAKHQEIGPELEYFLNAYKLLEGINLSVTDGHKKDFIDEPALRRRLFREPGIFWFQKEAVLMANTGKVISREFSAKSPLLLSFRLFWSAKQEGSGIRLEDLHRARLSVPFREELHAGAAKMLVSRLRELLKGFAEIQYDRDSRRYSLESTLPTYTIHSASQSKKTGKKRDREAEILQRLSMESFVSTKALCEEFGVSRQALHPVLKKLCAAGKIKLVFRGPISGYIFRG